MVIVHWERIRKQKSDEWYFPGTLEVNHYEIHRNSNASRYSDEILTCGDVISCYGNVCNHVNMLSLVLRAYIYVNFPLYLGTVHRYYESRRRIFNDSKPERQDQSAKNAITRCRISEKSMYVYIATASSLKLCHVLKQWS